MKTFTKVVRSRIFVMTGSTLVTFALHRWNPELMQILIDAGTFCGVVLLVIDKDD